MCGRFTLSTGQQEIADHFPLFDILELAPRYNIAPTQSVAAARVLPGDGKKQVVLLRWGLIPSWADDPAIGNRMINARSESVADKPAFRAAYRKRRCLIPADGFFEWHKEDGKKQPFYFRLRDGGVFSFAGLWEHWERDGRKIESCTILTTEANALVRPAHDRMPVILRPDEYERWLNPADQTATELTALLLPFPAAEMRAHPVSPRVNNVRHDDPECVAPAASAGQLF